MSNYHRPRAGAIALGTLCAALAGAVLAESAWRTGLTIDHALSIGALVITIAAGHMAVAQLRGWHVLRAAGLALVFLGGVTYTIVGTAGRTAEHQQQATAIVEEHGRTRTRLEVERTRAEKLRSEAEAMLGEVRRQHARECAGGAGKRCTGLQQSINVYEAALKGHATDLVRIDGTLSGLGTRPPANGKLVAFAELLEAVAGVDKARTIQRLTVAWPYVLPLLLEIGSIVFWTIGLGHGPAPASRTVRSRAVTAEVRTPGPSDRPEQSASEPLKPAIVRSNPEVRTIGRTDGPEQAKPRSRPDALAELLTILALGRTVPSQADLARSWHRPKQTVSDWLRIWEADGLIPARRQDGRVKSITKL